MELYPLLPGESIEVRAFRPGSPKIVRRFLSSWSAVEDAAAELDCDYDVYFGVAPRVPNDEGELHGRLDNVRRCPVVWLDLDAKGDITKEYRRVQLAQCPPTYLVDSGNGYHAYWALTEELEPKKAQRLMKQMAAYFRCDDTSDPTRILRVPNTRNYKSDPALFVDVIEDAPERVWDASALPVAPIPADERTSLSDHAKRAEIIASQGVPKGGATIDGEVFSGRDAALFEYACYLRDEQYDERDVMKMCLEANQLMSPPLSEATVGTKVRSAFTREAPPNIIGTIEAPLAILQSPLTAFVVQSMSDIVAYDEPATDWMAEGVLARGHIVYTMNPPKSGKTTVALNLALRMAAGKKGAGLYIDQPYRTLFLQPMGDMHPTLTREWTRKIGNGLHLDPDIPFHLAVLGERRDHFQYLSEHAMNYDLVIVDTISRLFPAVDDADTRTVSEELDKIRRLRMMYPNTCWLYLVQVGKNSLAHMRGATPGFAARGNSAIAEVFDDALQIIVPTTDIERDEELGLNLTRHIAMMGRGAAQYRKPWRTRFDPETHLIEWVQDLTYDEAIETTSTGSTTGPTQSSQAADLLGRLFLDAKEATGVASVLASDVYRIGDENGFSKRVMKLALDLRGGTISPARGPKAAWWDCDVEVVE